MSYTVSTKQNDMGWATGARNSIHYLPGRDTVQQFLFKSPRTKLSTWLQVSVDTGLTWEPGKSFGGSIIIILHSSDKSVLEDLVECARQQYEDTGASRVTVHLIDSNGTWAKTVTKSRRALSTLMLPSQIKETLLADAQEFLASEKISIVAVGTGKSSTVHAIAGEPGLELHQVLGSI
ncbi:hypothetical protein C8J57DRAFT_1520437 [Mycena rebaudengoi]|nr:hypothetical protein C8J57DRAFT_1520437 [Mycena rebaudengoi]